ncbi:hypothetical protein Tco_0291073 [Tanacetum coccineum]
MRVTGWKEGQKGPLFERRRGQELMGLKDYTRLMIKMMLIFTLAQALAALKSVKPKVKANVIEEPSSVPVSAANVSTKVSAATTTTAIIPTPRKGIIITKLGTPTTTRTISSQQPSQAKVQDKRKGIMGKDEAIVPTEEVNDIQAKLRAFKRVNTFVDFRTDLVEGLQSVGLEAILLMWSTFLKDVTYAHSHAG